jgi:hypothetical protein
MGPTQGVSSNKKDNTDYPGYRYRGCTRYGRPPYGVLCSMSNHLETQKGTNQPRWPRVFLLAALFVSQCSQRLDITSQLLVEVSMSMPCMHGEVVRSRWMDGWMDGQGNSISIHLAHEHSALWGECWSHDGSGSQSGFYTQPLISYLYAVLPTPQTINHDTTGVQGCHPETVPKAKSGRLAGFKGSWK